MGGSKLKKGEVVEVEIEKLVFGGEGLGDFNGQKIFVLNVLPGEKAKVEITQIKKDFLRGIANKILKPSPFRILPKEDHFLSCSPWQIIDFEKELEWKKSITQEVFRRIADFELPDFEIKTDYQQFHYRNKMEFSFIECQGRLSLAFYKRFSKKKIPIKRCLLAKEVINTYAKKISDWLNKNKINPEELKTLILRANQNDELIGALFVKNKNFPYLEISEILDQKLKGFSVWFSDPRSPASVFSQLLVHQGEKILTEIILGNKFYFSIANFFQINLPVFQMALKDIENFVDKKVKILDLYSGVGTIGFSLSKKIKKGLAVEVDSSAVELAKLSLKENKIKNFQIFLQKAEDLKDELLKEIDILIVDPPRPGLHSKLVKKILSTLPSRIIYLSCNPTTQARDFKLLQEKYQLIFFNLYNFFPRTPHIESLMILQRK